MKHLKAAIRILLVAATTLSIYLVYVVLLLFTKLFGYRYEPLRNGIMRFWANVISKILNLKIKVMGTPPEAPFFLVSNHLSYIDIIPIYMNLNCTFIAKREVKSWPVVGFIVKTMGIIFIDRKKKKDVPRVNKIISNSLNRHQGIILFPEGTTSSGKEVLPFRPPLLEHPAACELDVHFCSISYSTSENDLPASESVCWSGDVSFPGHFYKLAGTGRINCTITFGKETVKGKDRKILADKLFEKVQKQFQPV